MVTRRAFIGTLTGGLLAAPLAAEAQPATKVYRVGLVFPSPPVSEMAGPEPVNVAARAFVQGLRALGYVEGRNLILERRSAEGRFERFAPIVAELVSLNVDVIVVSSTSLAQRAREVTTAVPIVMGAVADPVGSGLVESLARPGGNVTGLTLDVGPEIQGKRLELLKGAVPRVSRIAFLGAKELWDALYEKNIKASAQALGLTVFLAEHTPTDYTGAFALISRERPDALFVALTSENYAQRRVIVDFATSNRLPNIHAFRESVEVGGLMSYGVNVADLFHRATRYVDKILKGAKPAHLPIEQPTKFELVINLKTAKALGLTIPRSVLARADQVIGGMKRRAFISSVTHGLLAVPLAVGAQQPGKVFRIGILSNVPLTDPEGARVWGAFIEGLRDLGYAEGQNITIVHRSSEGKFQRLPDLAAELVRLKVDVIIAPASQNVLAAKQASRTIPIVMAGSGDPVGAGLVASLARPGGNVTGLSMLSLEMAGKQLALLREMVPGVSRVAVLGNPVHQSYPPWLDEVKVAARSLGVQLQLLEARGPDDFERAFAAMARERAGALLHFSDGMGLLHRARIVELAAKHRLPVMYGLREFVDAGGFVVYGPSMRASFRRAATYVDKILKGAKPADLPIEQPTRFELIINLKTAKALGLTIPPSLLQRADQVIE